MRIPKKMVFLVVDDLTNMRRTIRNMLRSLDLPNIIEAEDGDVALDKIKETKIDFVVCDWNMPRLSGMELLRKVRDDLGFRDLPFLMVTAEVDESQIVQAAETDVDGYIIKPFVAKTLEDKVASILERRSNPSQLEIHMKLGNVYKDSGMPNKALEEFQKALKLSPKSARVLHSLGQVYESTGSVEEAEKHYNDAVQRNPQYIRVHQALGELYVKTGDKDKALKSIEKAAQISPHNSDRQVILGKLYLEKGNSDKAKEAFKSAVDTNPKDAELMSDIGDIYLEHDQAEEAAEAFQESLTINKSVHVYNRLGIALRKKKRFKEALQEYRKALDVDPNDEAIYYNMGRAFLEDRQLDNAVKCFRKALAIDPNFDECRKILEKAAAI